MSTKYKVGDNEMPHFISFSVVNWIDALTRNEYKDIIVKACNTVLQKKERIYMHGLL
jgi:putative transposase